MSAERIKCLLVEDDEQVQDILRGMLDEDQNLRGSYAIVNSFPQVKEFVESSHPLVMVTNLDLAVGHGFDVIRLGKEKDIPTAVLSGYLDQNSRETSLKIGAYASSRYL
jgi:DNA-binding NtrC family response regulator